MIGQGRLIDSQIDQTRRHCGVTGCDAAARANYSPIIIIGE